jgi:2-oxoglutarate ferredoxin oxidoreductase subunit beta
VWIATGDGDALSIGGNHLIHTLRRNVDVQILLFNNEIYGLTKGQYSPTSRVGTRTPSTPDGSVEAPLAAASLALGSGARFVARAIDTRQKQLIDVLKRAHAHRGASLVEIFQNCIVYNDEVFATFSAKQVAADRQLHVEHGRPLLFGRDGSRGLRLKPGTLTLEVVSVGAGGVAPADILVHDETNRSLAMMLAELTPPAMPMVLGVLYCNPDQSFEERLGLAARHAVPLPTAAALNGVLRRGHTWTVAG